MARRVRALVLGLSLGLGIACGATPPTAPDAIPTDTPPADDTGGETESALGEFRGLAGHDASGSVQFLSRDGIGTIVFSADFRSTRVPGPYVYLNTDTDANRGAPLRVGALQSESGAQSYSFQLPPGIAYTYVLVWCDPFNVGVGVARIE